MFTIDKLDMLYKLMQSIVVRIFVLLRKNYEKMNVPNRISRTDPRAGHKTAWTISAVEMTLCWATVFWSIQIVTLRGQKIDPFLGRGVFLIGSIEMFGPLYQIRPCGVQLETRFSAAGRLKLTHKIDNSRITSTLFRVPTTAQNVSNKRVLVLMKPINIVFFEPVLTVFWHFLSTFVWSPRKKVKFTVYVAWNPLFWKGL